MVKGKGKDEDLIVEDYDEDMHKKEVEEEENNPNGIRIKRKFTKRSSNTSTIPEPAMWQNKHDGRQV